MKKFMLAGIYLLTEIICTAQPAVFLNDTTFTHASLSVYFADASTGEPLMDYFSGKSLTPASILKLITTATALEKLGPGHTFTTSLGYYGKARRSGQLDGDIIIKGGGDPTFASSNFPDNYTEFPVGWVKAIRQAGIRKINGRIVTDDSYFDYLPVPAKWLWEDAGNYYGAGVYGASVYDNTYQIHLKTFSDSAKPQITGIVPEDCRVPLVNGLVSYGTTDQGYVFAAPYSSGGWLAGSVPENTADFILEASIPDPPLLIARVLDKNLRATGMKINDEPATSRSLGDLWRNENIQIISTITSPPLSDIITVLNHESVNLYAEHLLKELGKVFAGNGSTEAGIRVVYNFLDSIGIDVRGMYIVDGSGLSPVNSITAKGMTNLLIYMRNNGNYFEYYFNSLPEAGKEGTLKNYFLDEAFNSVMKAKSGSMTRVRSYAGYITTKTGRNLAFCMIANDFSGSSRHIVNIFEEILKDVVLNH